jgi:hypothetical protein
MMNISNAINSLLIIERALLDGAFAGHRLWNFHLNREVFRLKRLIDGDMTSMYYSTTMFFNSITRQHDQMFIYIYLTDRTFLTITLKMK